MIVYQQPLAEKENQRASLELIPLRLTSSGFTGAQTMFWQIDTSGDYTADANDFVHTRAMLI